MTEEVGQKVQRPILSSISAQLFVADIQASCDFYTDKLGFAVDFVYGDPPFYGQVTRDNARLSLRHVDEPVFAGDVRERENLLSASITLASTDEIKQLFLSYQAMDVPFHQTLKQEPWGATDYAHENSSEVLHLKNTQKSQGRHNDSVGPDCRALFDPQNDLAGKKTLLCW